MVQYIQHLEARKIQQTYTEEYYSRELLFKIEDIVFDNDEDGGESESKSKSNNDNEDNVDGNDKNVVEIEPSKQDRPTGAEIEYYP
ncbi:hypothetical protein FRC12_005023 [Ceratobasidium sp. 428]|nr:hypothetical protein FRC12_005023 [Ceratobasidium sp. 428]